MLFGQTVRAIGIEAGDFGLLGRCFAAGKFLAQIARRFELGNKVAPRQPMQLLTGFRWRGRIAGLGGKGGLFLKHPRALIPLRVNIR